MQIRAGFPQEIRFFVTFLLLALPSLIGLYRLNGEAFLTISKAWFDRFKGGRFPKQK